jgi:hypothetical protein
VLASEYNDFGGNLDQHSYEACLANIDQADFFVLLIGSRVGGWFDESTRTRAFHCLSESGGIPDWPAL